MYLVRWNDHEGNLKERPFGSSENALLEAEALRKDYDFVEVIRAGGRKMEEERIEEIADPSPVRRSVTLSALLNILPPDLFLTVFHRLGPNALEAVTSGTVRQLRNSRCTEVCGLNAVERVALDDPAPGMMIVTIGEKEP